MVVSEVQWLDFVLVGQFVQRQTLTGDTGVDLGSEIVVVLDDLATGHRIHSQLSALNHFPQHLDLSPLNLRNQTILVLGLPNLDLLDPALVLLLDVLLALSERGLEEIELIVLDPGEYKKTGLGGLTS